MFVYRNGVKWRALIFWVCLLMWEIIGHIYIVYILFWFISIFALSKMYMGGNKKAFLSIGKRNLSIFQLNYWFLAHIGIHLEYWCINEFHIVSKSINWKDTSRCLFSIISLNIFPLNFLLFCFVPYRRIQFHPLTRVSYSI